MVNEVRYATEDNWHHGDPLGVWGGECTCPDGRVYTAGDRGNFCGSTNCFGGTEGRCIQAQGRWAFREVHCAPFPQRIGPGDTVLENQHRTAGIWGGTCTCPNGNVYLVGDRNDQCKSLSCEGGVSGVCNRYASTWSHRKVVCAPSETSPPPAASGCLDWCETDFVTPVEKKCGWSRCENCTFCPKPPPPHPLPPPPPAFPAASPRPPPPSPSPPPPPSPLQSPVPSPPPPPPELQSPPPGLQSPPPPSPPSPPGKLLQRLETRAAKEAEKKTVKEERTSSKTVQQSAELSLTQRPTSTERLARMLPAGVTPAQAVAGAAAAFLALLATLLLLCCCCARWRRSGASGVGRKGTSSTPTRDSRKGRRQRLPVDEEVGADEIRHSKMRDTKRSPRNKGKPSVLQPDADNYVI